MDSSKVDVLPEVGQEKHWDQGTGKREVEEIRNGSSNEKGRKILEETNIQRKTNASVMGQ